MARLAAFDLDKEFCEARLLAHRQRDEVNISFEDALDGILMEELFAKKQQMALHSPQHEAPLLSIFQVLHNHRVAAQRIGNKMKVLFMLRKCADWSIGDAAQIRTVTDALVAGTQGRCADGQASFFNSWLAEHILNGGCAGGEGEEQELRSLQLGVSLLMVDLKRTYIMKHCSRFAHGRDIGAYDASEDRTAMDVLLHSMLRLPLSLPGDTSQVRYPRFAFRSLDNSADALRIDALMTRFLKGGKVFHTDSHGQARGERVVADRATRVITEFPPLSLKRLGRELRESMVTVRKLAPGGNSALPGLLPEPRMTYCIDEAVVTKFAAQDSVLSTPWAKFQGSHFTQSNAFFDAEKALLPGGAAMRNVLKDAALLRILEVCGYAIVPEGFWWDLKRDWQFD